jgi:xyloglucan-specific exo-beta-1,4-glucanase
VTVPRVGQYAWSSTPGGGTWADITGNLPSLGVSKVIYDRGTLVAATDAGVYATASTNGASMTWTILGSGMPNVQVQDLFVDPATSNLYALTHGRGAWLLPGPRKAR